MLLYDAIFTCACYSAAFAGEAIGIVRDLIWPCIVLLHGCFTRRKRKRQRAHRRRLTDLAERPRLATDRNQGRSAFLDKLPLELRQMVYEQFYDGSELTIKKIAQGSLGSRLVAFRDPQNMRYFNGLPWNGGRVRNGLLELPLTCRQM